MGNKLRHLMIDCYETEGRRPRLRKVPASLPWGCGLKVVQFPQPQEMHRPFVGQSALKIKFWNAATLISKGGKEESVKKVETVERMPMTCDIIGAAETHGMPMYYDYIRRKVWPSHPLIVSLGERAAGGILVTIARRCMRGV